MNVLSLFDGISCGQLALVKAGINYHNYYASEIDKHPIKITMQNFPNTIQLGNVVNIKTDTLPKIDLLIGGSPCQSFSLAGKREGMVTTEFIEVLSLEHYRILKEQNYQFKGQSYLFWEYVRILKELNPTFFLLENVIMEDKWASIISKSLGVNPIEINSQLVSAQFRKRLYWTNIGMIPMGLFGDLESIIEQPKDRKLLLRDILETDVNQKYFLSDSAIKRMFGYDNAYRNLDDTKKSTPLHSGYWKMGRDNQCVFERKVLQVNQTNLKSNSNTQPYQQDRVYDVNGISPALMRDRSDLKIYTGSIRRLTPVECERLQCVPDNYTLGIADYQRYKALGNGFTIDVIAHLLNYLPNQYKLNP